MGFNPLTAGIRLTGKLAYETYTEFAPFQFDRPSSQLEKRYANEESEFLQVDDARIHYRDEGPADAPTLLAIHGTYSSLHTWDGWVEDLRDEFRIVRLDLPGFGLTGPRSRGTHTLDYLVDAVGEFCDELGLSDVTAIGSSLGGGVAWRLSIDRPDVVSRLVLVNAGGATLLSELAANVTAFGTQLVPRYMTPRMAIRTLVRDAYGDKSKVTRALVTRYHDLLLRPGNRRAVIEIAAEYEDKYDGDDTAFRMQTPKLPSEYDPEPTIWDDYDTEDVTVPTLFLWGTADEWLPVSFGEELAAGFSDVEFVRFEGVGHVPMEEAPTETVHALREFLHTDRRTAAPTTH